MLLKSIFKRKSLCFVFTLYIVREPDGKVNLCSRTFLCSKECGHLDYEFIINETHTLFSTNWYLLFYSYFLEQTFHKSPSCQQRLHWPEVVSHRKQWCEHCWQGRSYWPWRIKHSLPGTATKVHSAQVGSVGVKYKFAWEGVCNRDRLADMCSENESSQPLYLYIK